MAQTKPSPAPQATPLRLPLPKQFLTEKELCFLIGSTPRGFRQRDDAAKPPCIMVSPRRRLYDPDEVAAWIASLPRSK